MKQNDIFSSHMKCIASWKTLY